MGRSDAGGIFFLLSQRGDFFLETCLNAFLGVLNVSEPGKPEIVDDVSSWALLNSVILVTTLAMVGAKTV